MTPARIAALEAVAEAARAACTPHHPWRVIKALAALDALPAEPPDEQRKAAWVEAAARALAVVGVGHDRWDDLTHSSKTMCRNDARACLTAALAAAEADGVVLATVPEPEKYERGAGASSAGFVIGHNACRDAVLAGKVTL